MKKLFKMPHIEVVLFDVEDVITTSSADSNGQIPGFENQGGEDPISYSLVEEY